MTATEFKKLLDLAISKGNIADLEKTYVMLTWWDDKFMPLDCIDGNYRMNESYLVFGDTPCNKWHNGIPCAFCIDDEAVHIEDVARRPVSLQRVVNAFKHDNDGTVKFLLCNSPKNVWVDINPFRTMVIRNQGHETMLCFYVDDRDSGEMVPFDRITEDNIKVIDADEEVGKYKYGSWSALPTDCGTETPAMCDSALGGTRESAPDEAVAAQ